MAKGNPELGAEGGEQKEISSAQQLINDYKAYTGCGSK